ncbi:methyltransferase domain-containing protein [Paraburkholderia guartelaensis]|uniref:Methyltransferase domain-containing protein n=1 Tax=Paraburkholderia guartelaensis TaxID=2546446 RepID=A0A4R5LH31_9BURK|nr:methyltransferase domain-containing protein [Paraburkholderia guartelaensis]TDG08569.1 methyltransferase domain-containing protein [Paraburkholderia guartelaensis]
MSDPTLPPQPGEVPEFETRDPASPSFWDERFARGFTPWDQAGVQRQFEVFATAHPEAAVLIPGCGNAWEARWLAERGRTVRAIDFAPAAVASARAALGQYADVVEEADFYAYTPPFTPAWVFERAFLCALPKAQRASYATRMAQLLQPGALLAGYFFIGETPKGPPFAIARDELDALLTPYFTLADDQPVADSLPVFVGRERWLVWCRNDVAPSPV